jgi:hypothetical protein
MKIRIVLQVRKFLTAKRQARALESTNAHFSQQPFSFHIATLNASFSPENLISFDTEWPGA